VQCVAFKNRIKNLMQLIFMQKKNEISGIAFEKKSLLAKYDELIEAVIASPHFVPEK
jgi:hypothetical protein